ncbi:TetR/AcrR family transcriptional regulator [Brevibacillus sp. IT-7CA2]|uniref:TetR/AcrR family transcriptional regulator n=1 Tax=Brevibacillus sp. IT-7CA2 TaxID=3026436 RepID=UPI0039E00C09
MKKQEGKRGTKMSDNDSNKRRPVGRPRSELSKNAIIEALITLLEESGFAALTIEAIATQAGVGKATIYRWWPNKSALLLDAFLMTTEPNIRLNEEVSVEENFRNQLQNLAKVFNSAIGRTTIAMVADSGADSEEAKAFASAYLKPNRELAKKLLTRGIDRGEIKPQEDFDVLLDMFYGPVYFRVLIHKKKLDHTFVDMLVEQVMKSIRTPS